MNKPRERTPLPAPTLSAIMDRVDNGKDIRIPVTTSANPEQQQSLANDLGALEGIYRNASPEEKEAPGCQRLRVSRAR